MTQNVSVCDALFLGHKILDGLIYHHNLTPNYVHKPEVRKAMDQSRDDCRTQGNEQLYFFVRLEV